MRAGFAGGLIGEMETEIALRLLERDQRRHRGACRGRCLGRDGAVLLHAAEHIGAALAHAIGIAVGTEIARPLRQPGQHGGLRQVEVLGGFSEIAARRHLDPPGAAPQIDRVEIKLEDLVLAQHALDPRGQHDLAHLALVADVVADQEVLDHLLGDGGGALRPPGLAHIGDRGADQAALVDAGVLVEALVLGGHECLLHRHRNFGERHRDAALVGIEHLPEAAALAVQHDGRAGQLEALEPRRVGQVGQRLVIEVDHGAGIEAPVGNLLVGAELMVGALQVGELDAAEGGGAPRRQVRILHGGRQQVVEIDVLDLEHLAHVAAAVAQQRDHLALIGGAVEFGLERFGRRGHLAQA